MATTTNPVNTTIRSRMWSTAQHGFNFGAKPLAAASNFLGWDGQIGSTLTIQVLAAGKSAYGQLTPPELNGFDTLGNMFSSSMAALARSLKPDQNTNAALADVFRTVAAENATGASHATGAALHGR